MWSLAVLFALALFPISHCQVSTSPKRGLVYVPSQKHPSDDQIWVSSSSDLTWYYNYGATPSSAYAKSSKLQFVPMLWGAQSNNSFLDAVQQQISDGANISYVLTFNEPDGSTGGGSNVPAALAAEIWMREVEPLKQKGVKLGAPAVTGAPSGFTWLQSFFTACNGNCSADFIPVHWYGNFEGLASHVGQVRATYPNMTMWVTEYADPGAKMADTQSFYNQSSQFFDRIEYVSFFLSTTQKSTDDFRSYITRYSYFGAFRSDVSNVGPTAAFLTQDGKLTNIGSWYLGGTATNNVPKGSAGRSAAFAGSSLLVLFAVFWCLA